MCRCGSSGGLRECLAIQPRVPTLVRRAAARGNFALTRSGRLGGALSMKSMGTRAGGARLERMQASPLWAADRFQNVHPVLPNLRDPTVPMPSLKDFMCGGERRLPRAPLPSMDPLNAWAEKSQSGLRVTWLGHSTMLIEIDGVRILTDPVWGPRASPSALIGPKRFQPVPISLREMPPVDVVVVSHDHYDHLDYPTIRALAKTSVPFVTSLGV